MGKEDIDCEGNVAEKKSVDLPDGSTQIYTKFVSFDAEQMVECTELTQEGEGGEVEEGYTSLSHHGDVTIAFSYEAESSKTHLLDVSLSGGSPEAKQVVLEQFENVFKKGVEELKWTSISRVWQEPIKGGEKYTWEAILFDLKQVH